MPGQVFIFWLVLVPQVRRRWRAGKLLFGLDVQWFRMATRAKQSSTRSLLAPRTLVLSAVATKVPSVQPVADSIGMLLEAGGLVVVGVVVGRVVGVGRVVVVVVGRVVVVAVGVLVRWQAMGL